MHIEKGSQAVSCVVCMGDDRCKSNANGEEEHLCQCTEATRGHVEGHKPSQRVDSTIDKPRLRGVERARIVQLSWVSNRQKFSVGNQYAFGIEQDRAN